MSLKMKKFLIELKKDIKHNWHFYITEAAFLLFFEFVILKLEPIKAIFIVFSTVFVSLVLVIAFGLRDVIKN